MFYILIGVRQMTADVSTDTIEAKKKVSPLGAHCLTFEDYRFVRHCMIVPRDFDPQLLTESGVYLSIAHRLHALDRLTVIWEDRSAMADVMVLEASQSFTSTVVLNYKKLPGMMIGDGSDALVNFEIFYSQIDGYCARRLSDSVLIVQNATSKENCIQELKSHPAFKAD
jgi:hypothetical protein